MFAAIRISFYRSNKKKVKSKKKVRPTTDQFADFESPEDGKELLSHSGEKDNANDKSRQSMINTFDNALTILFLFLYIFPL